MFSFIPNVQPVTAMLLIIAYTIGWRESLIIASLTMLVSNMLLGMGPWLFFQIMSYIVVIIFGYILDKIVNHVSSSRYFIFGSRTFYAGFAGILYGLIISILWVRTLSFKQFWLYYLNGLPYDFAHAVGNAIFFVLLYPILSKLLTKFYQKIR